MEIKPKLNLKWYKNVDNYSDGDVEDDIIRYIQENDPENYEMTIVEHYSWPVYYHLTHTRKNLLNWYPFRKDASVLEIGCGLGAITGLLCDKCEKVTAVELSKRRATATQIRCREKDNLEIIVGNLNDIEFTEKFDYITLIGVLEYQGTYTDSDNPYKEFLVKIKSLLKKQGKLLIAIENKYGVKYWCGAPEDHTGIPFDGLNQYKISNRKVCTFSKEELRELLVESGFLNLFYYYPLPDYKLPTVVYSEKYLPRVNALEGMVPYYVPSNQTLLVEETGLYKDIVKNQVFEFFANSFLVECSVEKQEEEKTIFALMNSKRQPEYRIGTVIRDSGKVAKIALERDTNIHNHLVQSLRNMKGMELRGAKVLTYVLEENELVTDFMKLPTLAELVYEALDKKDMERVWELCDRILEQIESVSDEVEQEKCLIYELGLDRFQEGKSYGKILHEGYVDMIPRNCFVQGQELWWFDQEWILDNIPSKFILFRGILTIYASFPELGDKVPAMYLFRHYGMDIHLEVFLNLARLFESMVMNKYYAGNIVERRDDEIYRKNILKII